MPGDGINIRSNSKQRSERSQNVTPMRDESRNVCICAFGACIDSRCNRQSFTKSRSSPPKCFKFKGWFRGASLHLQIHEQGIQSIRMHQEKTFTYGTIHLMEVKSQNSIKVHLLKNLLRREKMKVPPRCPSQRTRRLRLRSRDAGPQGYPLSSQQLGVAVRHAPRTLAAQGAARG